MGTKTKHDLRSIFSEESLLSREYTLPAARAKETKCCNNVCCCIELWKISAAFFLVFTGFSGAQNLESSQVVGNYHGSVSVGIIYVAFTATCLLAPIFVRILGTKTTIVLQFCIISLFCGANIYPGIWTMYPISGLLGVGAASMWVAQGQYVSTLAENCRQGDRDVFGIFNGIFYGVFQMTQLSGNLISAYVLDRWGETNANIPMNTRSILYTCFIISCCSGVILMQCFVQPLKPRRVEAYSKIEDEIETDEGSVKRYAGSTFRLMLKPRLFLLIPMMLASGLEQGFAFSTLTANVIKVNLGEENIGFGMICFAIMDTIGSVLFGGISDQAGYSACFFSCFIIQNSCALWLFFFFGEGISENEWTITMAICGVWGLGDGIITTLLSALLGSWFPTKKPAAFANWKMWQSLGIAAMFFLHDYLCLKTMLLMVMSAWAAGMIGLILVIVLGLNKCNKYALCQHHTK